MSIWLAWLSQHGLILVFGGAALEGETVIVLAGMLTHQGVLPFTWTVYVAAMGAFMGDQVLFRLGRHYGQGTLNRFPRLAHHADRVEPWVQSRADWVAVSSRFVYGMRSVMQLMLGTYRYPAMRFLLINLFTALLWAIAGVSGGYLVGNGAEKLLGDIIRFEQFLLLAMIIILGGWWYRRRRG
ncbi:MAG: DedA family protein [Gammaproteobacteria bacterium]|nr:DedA family protein [Gammaproteobacteria bacterium]